NCKELQSRGTTRNGTYIIKSADVIGMGVYCDMETDGGGWLVFKRRKDGPQDLFLT
ncbi:hypothetical protein CAPTEDRAFT_126237, partial [Capitella teleta]